MDRSRDELEEVWWDGVRSLLLAGDWDDEGCRCRTVALIWLILGV